MHPQRITVKWIILEFFFFLTKQHPWGYPNFNFHSLLPPSTPVSPPPLFLHFLSFNVFWSLGETSQISLSIFRPVFNQDWLISLTLAVGSHHPGWCFSQCQEADQWRHLQRRVLRGSEQTGVVPEGSANYPSVHQSLRRELKKEVIIYLLKAHQLGQQMYTI